MRLFLEGLREGLQADELHHFIHHGLEVEHRLSPKPARRKRSA
jgi:hypothetical protein